MLSSRVRCALALLSLALAVSCVSAAPSDLKLRQLLQRSLLAPASKQLSMVLKLIANGMDPLGTEESLDISHTSSRQDLTRYTLAELLSELAQVENEALEPDELSRAADQEEVRLELERAAGPVLAPRERKAGCKNFFWKTFTSC